jgi:hypothetical protein
MTREQERDLTRFLTAVGRFLYDWAPADALLKIETALNPQIGEISRKVAQWENDFYTEYLTENRYADIEPVVVTPEMRAAFLQRVAKHFRAHR